MIRLGVLLCAFLIAQTGALSRLKLRHPIPYFLTSSDMVRLDRSVPNGLEDNSIERLEIKELEKRNDEGTFRRISLITDTREMNIELQPMTDVVSPNLRVTVINGRNMQEREVHASIKDSFYQGKIEGVDGGVASLMKSAEGWKGLVFADGEAFAVNNEQSTGEHVLMKMINDEYKKAPLLREAAEQKKRDNENEKRNSEEKEDKSGLKLEVGVYTDEALYDYVKERYNQDDTVATIQKLAVLTINTVKIYYHKPTLGTTIDVVVAKLVIHEDDPPELEVAGDITTYLSNFCDWEAENKNPRGLHYDVALMLTGLDLYAEIEDDNGVTGIAPYGGCCKQFSAGSCVISEALEMEAGIVSAHEFGHCLGMEHDGDGNNCPSDEYIMGSVLSPGATEFSSCSKKALDSYIKELDDFNNNCLRTSVHEKTLDFENDMLPGERLEENEQCYYALGFFWYDEIEAKTYCTQLSCWSLVARVVPNGGPPLPGSRCGTDKICWDGKCLEKSAVDEIRNKNQKRSSSPPTDPLSLNELCVKYGRKEGYTVGVDYNHGLEEDSDEFKEFCESGLICMTPDEELGYRYWNYPVPPGTACNKEKVCKHYRCEDKNSPEPPMDSSNVTKVVSGVSSKDDENTKPEKPVLPIPTETRDGVAEFCKKYASKTAVPVPTSDCSKVTCEDELYSYKVPAYLFNMCPDGQICTFEGYCISDSGKPLDGELTKEELEDANKLCKDEYGDEYQSLCTKAALSFSLTAAEYCYDGLCSNVACFAFLDDNMYSLNSFPTPRGSPCGNGDTCGFFGCGSII